MKSKYEDWVNEPEVTRHMIRFTGAGAGNPTKNLGAGLTVTWISTGLYEITWAEAPGLYAGFLWSLQDTTAATLKGFTVVAGDYNTSTLKLRVSVTNQAETLVDLASTSKATVHVFFKETGV